jgi:hypothetical protein
MRSLACAVGLIALLVLGILVVAGRIPAGAPSTEACVDLWNAPHNASIRALVAAHNFPVAQIQGLFVEDREEGCSAWFVRGIGEPWALYGATRVPRDDRPLRWVFQTKGQRLRIDSPEPAPKPNAVVFANGSLSLRDTDISG